MAQQTQRRSLSIALTGSGGAGVITAGSLLLDAAGKMGLYGLQTRSVGPQIRGGEAAALLRLADWPVETHSGAFGLLLALDWNNFSRFAAEIALGPDSVVVSDPAAGPLPDPVREATGKIIELPLKAIADDIEGGRVNMVAVGLAAGAVGLEEARLVEVIAEKLAAKGAGAVASGIECLRAGYGRAALLEEVPKFDPVPTRDAGGRWLLTGNEAAGVGAVRGGIRFAAAYPITPATEILEWLAPNLARCGGALVQAEDELASVNMIIGASFGGVPSLTATSGPGLALMTESIGLATASEVPIVVVDVMRGGPSTGIPTKSEQSDLNIAVYGLHGDAPHIVVAPTSLADCLFTTQWAVHLAESMQAPAIVLSDQFLGQARMIVDRPADVAFVTRRRTAQAPAQNYARYALSGDGVSAMAIPGCAGGQYTADGLSHAISGTPSSAAEDHISQLAKRRRKVEGFDYGDHWAETDGEGDHLILTWGSTAASVREAAARARARGIPVRTLALRLIAPLQGAKIDAHVKEARRVTVIEQNESGQFYRYLRSRCTLPADTHALHHPGPLPITPDEVYDEIIKDYSR